MPLSSLDWISRFTDQTPGDVKVGGTPRQVPGACWSRVSPTPAPDPVLRLWSSEMADELGIVFGEGEILGGRVPVEGMDPYAQRYGGTNSETGPASSVMAGRSPWAKWIPARRYWNYS